MALTLAGGVFGAFALLSDAGAKRVIMPFAHLQGTPSERVRHEETAKPTGGSHSQFSAKLITHNTRVSILALALGMSAGIGTILLAFYNGVILGAVAADYVRDGQAEFLLGWLLPHGIVEIPAILIGVQAGFVLATAVIGHGDRRDRRARLRSVAPSVVTLGAGAALLLVWAGFVESFISQFHAPVLPYGLKIAFGCAEGILLFSYLFLAGRKSEEPRP